VCQINVEEIILAAQVSFVFRSGVLSAKPPVCEASCKEGTSA